MMCEIENHVASNNALKLNGRPIKLQCPQEGTKIAETIPKRLIDVLGDGDCLFRCISKLLSGSEDFCHEVRLAVCCKILSYPFHNNQLLLQNGQTCTSTTEYVSASKMNYAGTYATGVELLALSSLLNVEIVVFIDMVQQWVIYKSVDCSSSKQFFLLHCQDHFQIIQSLDIITSTTILNEIIDEPTSPVLTQSMLSSQRIEDALFRSLSPESADNVNLKYLLKRSLVHTPLQRGHSEQQQPDSSTIEQGCLKCLRTSTEKYVLSVRCINLVTCKNTKIGMELPKQTTGYLCTQCEAFLCENRTDFQNRWPSILCSYFKAGPKDILTKVMSHLPQSVMEMYAANRSQFSICFNDLFSNFHYKVSDRTDDLRHILQVVDSLKGDPIKQTFNKFCLPDVICPWGCWEFLEKCQKMSFEHFLKTIDETQATKLTDFLKGADPNFPQSYTFLNKFELSPGCIIDHDGSIFILTCRRHSGNNLQYIRPPSNPITKNISPNVPERLAIVQQQLKIIKPGATKFNSHSSHLILEEGSRSGICSSTLTSEPFLHRSTTLQDFVEPFVARERTEIGKLLRYYVERNIVDESYVDFLFHQTHDLTPEEMRFALGQTNCVSLYDCFKIQQSLNQPENGVHEPEVTPVYAHPPSTYDPHGFQPERKVKSKKGIPSCLEGLMRFSTKFTSLIKMSESNIVRKLGVQLSLMLQPKNNNQTNKLNVHLDEIYTDLESQVQSNVNPSRSILHCILQSCDIGFLSLESRQYIFNDDSIVDNHGIVCYLAPSRTERNYISVPPEHIEIRGKKYHLKMLCIEASKGDFFIRHCGNYTSWFRSHDKFLCFSKVTETCYTESVQRSSWDFCVYELEINSQTDSILKKYIHSIDGQTLVKCGVHHTYLIQSCKEFKLKCSIADNCNKQTKWTCPYPSCTASVCKPHHDVIVNDTVETTVEPIDTNSCKETDNSQTFDTEATDDQSGSNNELEENDSLLDFVSNPMDFLTDSGSFDEPGVMATDAGCNSHEYQFPSQYKQSIPMKVLLNNNLNILQRSNVPIWSTDHHRNFLQSIVTKIPGLSVPLLYPEGLLFPTIFWSQNKDGSFNGAIPSFMFQSDQDNKRFGFATLQDHLWYRLTNGTLQTSSNLHYASFAFDIKMNQELNNNHSTFLIFKRGFENQLGDDDAMELPATDLKFDGINSRKRVQELAAACSEESAKYFLTLTCNMSEHFGIKPLFLAIKEYHQNSPKDVYDAAVQSCMSLFVRMWERVSSIVMKYIEMSPEQPLGPVTRIWWRYEFQSTQANLPHIHCLIWSNESKHDQQFQERVVARLAQLLSQLDSQKYKDLNLVQDSDDAFRIYKQAVGIHFHNCEASGFRCHKRVDVNGQSHCRFPPYPPSMEYFLDEVDVSHSDEAFLILKKCGLAIEKEGYANEMVVSQELQAGQWKYPKTKGENLTPMSPDIFVLTSSQNNLLICDKYLQARYIAKYAAGVDEKAKMFFSAGNDDAKVNIDLDILQNTKIDSVKYRLKQEKEQRESKKKSVEARFLCITECYWHLFDMPFVYSSFSSVCIQTHEKECRPGIKMKNLCKNVNADAFTDRHGLPQWRQFSSAQKTLIKLSVESNVSLDNVTAFSLRPPELMFIRNPKDYFWFLERIKVSKHTRQNIIEQGGWIDGVGRQLLIRKKRVLHFLLYLKKSNHPTAHSLLNSPTLQHNAKFHVSPHADLRSSCVVYFSKIYPNDPFKFLVHLLLSMGQFDTEYELFNCSSLKEAFPKGGFNLNDTPENVAIKITRKYILEQALHLPGSTRMFDRNIVNCYNVLLDFLRNRAPQFFEPPRVLLSTVTASIDERASHFLQITRQNIAKGICCSDKVVDCPTQLELQHASTDNCLDYHPKLLRLSTQTTLSFDKQTTVLKKFVEAIDIYRYANSTFVPHQFVLGCPGTGKSTITITALCYAMSKGLNCMVTTLSGEKAAQFGGIHLHRLIPIPINNFLTVVKQVESTVQKLYLNPMRLLLLKQLDVLVVEELGMLSSQQWAILDQTLKIVNGNNIPMGGILVLGNGDPKQLRPPQGDLIWHSPILMTNFNLFYLTEYVRMMDEDGAEVLKILDKDEILIDDAEKLVAILQKPNNCKFVPNWDSLPTDSTCLRVVPTKKAERTLVERNCNLIRQSNVPCISIEAVDEVTPVGKNAWSLNKDPNVIKCLNRNCLEQNSLFLFDKAPMRLTRNLPEQGLSQGQLCVIDSLPSLADNKIVLWAAPPCVRELPPMLSDGTRNYVTNGWRKVKVNKMQGLPVYFNKKLTTRRTQFPLKSFQASTIHKCIGDDVPKLATQIASNNPSESRMFNMWDRNQLLVLLSRVNYLSNLIFVGPKQQVIEKLKDVAMKRNQWDSYINNFVSSLKEMHSNSNNITIPVKHHLYAASRLQLPTTLCPTIFALVALSDNSVVVSRSYNVRTSLYQFNTLNEIVPSELGNKRPWALLAAVFNLPEDLDDGFTINLECCWKDCVQSYNSSFNKKMLSELEEIVLQSTNFDNQLKFVAFVN